MMSSEKQKLQPRQSTQVAGHWQQMTTKNWSRHRRRWRTKLGFLSHVHAPGHHDSGSFQPPTSCSASQCAARHRLTLLKDIYNPSSHSRSGQPWCPTSRRRMLFVTIRLVGANGLFRDISQPTRCELQGTKASQASLLHTNVAAMLNPCFGHSFLQDSHQAILRRKSLKEPALPSAIGIQARKPPTYSSIQHSHGSHLHCPSLSLTHVQRRRPARQRWCPHFACS